MQFQPRASAILRFIAISTVAIAALAIFGRDLVETLLPVVRGMLGLLDDSFRVIAMNVTSQGGDTVIQASFALAQSVTIGTHTLYPNPLGEAQVSTLSAYVLQPLALALILIATWPAKAGAEWLLRIVILAPLTLLVFTVDIPFVLLGELWTALVDAYAPGSFSPLVAWKDFLQGGGRFALGLAVGALSILAADCIARRFNVIALTHRLNDAGRIKEWEAKHS